MIFTVMWDPSANIQTGKKNKLHWTKHKTCNKATLIFAGVRILNIVVCDKKKKSKTKCSLRATGMKLYD